MKKLLPTLLLSLAALCHLAPAAAQARLPTVVLGDSITNGGAWTDNFPNETVINQGVSGDTTEGMLARVDAVNAARPGKVLIMAGINDLLRGKPVETTLANYAQILARLDDGGKRLVVQSTLFTRPPANVLVNDQVRALDEALFRLCTANRRCTYIDVNQVVAPQGFLIADFTVDGLHLNQPGYEAWFKLLKERRLMN